MSTRRRIPSVDISTARTHFTLPVTVARSSSDGNAVRYVLPVLWMTSCYHIVQGIGQNERQSVFSSNSPDNSSSRTSDMVVWSRSPGGGTEGGGRSLPSKTASCL